VLGLGRRRGFSRAGFSLIEVLIAVVVLAIGLLGLGMVFPVVVRQQRIAQDNILGVSAARSAVSLVESRGPMIVELRGQIEKKLAPFNNRTGVWQSAPLVDVSSGGMSFNDQNGDPVSVAVTERLSPAPFTSAGGPQFVWDIAVQELENDEDRDFLVAIFSRRIDAGIRVPISRGKESWTMTNVLTGFPGRFPKEAKRLPLGLDKKTWRPTLDGTGGPGTLNNYAALETMRLRFPLRRRPGESNEPPAWLDLNDQAKSEKDRAMLDLARQPGQKFVDVFGDVHTVLRADPAQPYRVQLEKPISPALYEALRKLPSGNDPAPQQFVVMSPQIPAGVEIVRVSR
jgi:prepilin-type N-terminal cleavage/methylation domain-containing protein